MKKPENLTQFERFERNAFIRGYSCAVANIIRTHDEPTIAEDVFAANFYSVYQLRVVGVDESDIQVLEPIIKEHLRKRKLRIQSDEKDI